MNKTLKAISLFLLFAMGIGSVEAQSDKTSLITSPDFEEGMTGWYSLSMKKQTNTSFTAKSGSVYVEKWVGQGNKAGDAYIRQTLKNLTNGRYQLKVAAQNVQQNSSDTQTGAWIIANDHRLEVNKAGEYTMEFTLIEGELTLGFEAIGATGNYLACDNFRLYLLSDDLAVLKEELQNRIDKAEQLLTPNPEANGKSDLQTVIDRAKEDISSAPSESYPAIAQALKRASMAFRLANATGSTPSVSTHSFVARGATMAFGRNSVSGISSSDLLEQGFCWSTHPEPTVLDSRTTKFHNQNGRIYTMEDLTPSTVYYMRAYAMTKSYAVGYGEVVKVITLPKGNVSWGYDNGADAAANTRIRTAVADAVHYLNHLTSINGLYANVHFGSETPTADCSYGGWMRVGPSSTYQRTGTILHELGHGIGVGTHSIWNGGSSPMRSGSGRGDWLGDRATAVVRFLNNDNTSVMTGDGTHMWPYGINGANEDNDDPMLYMSNALIYQALGEDGLPPTGGFATPAYTFEQEDTIKYYIKNEDDLYGLRTSYLVVENGQLKWKQMSGKEALADDHAAWYVTFTPDNSYYQLRNAATALYLAHGGKVSAQAGDFHMMRSRINTTVGNSASKVSVRGYWLVQPQNSLNPPCLTGAANGKVTTSSFDLTNGATAQRWIFMEADEVKRFDQAANSSFMGELDIWVARIDSMLAIPHTEEVEGTDAALAAISDSLKQQISESPSATAIATYVEIAKEAIMAFLPNVTPTNINRPFDITYMITNATIDDNSGWSEKPTFNYSCLEFFESTFDFNQTLPKMPKGVYQLRVQAFQRPGASADAYASYAGGNNLVTTDAYIGSKTQKIHHIAVGAQEQKLGGNEVGVGTPVRYLPDNMLAASRYFALGLYDNTVTMRQIFDKRDITLGLRSSTTGSKFWTIFDNFRLFYYGDMDLNTVTGIEEMESTTDTPTGPTGIFSITGARIRTDAAALDNLPAGIYIVNGRKVIVR